MNVFNFEEVDMMLVINDPELCFGSSFEFEFLITLPHDIAYKFSFPMDMVSSIHVKQFILNLVYKCY